MSAVPYRLRKATPGDCDAVLRMQKHSVRVLGQAFYTEDVIESALRHIGTMDPDVIGEGHFYVAVTEDDGIVGSGGWSRRAPGYDGGHGRSAAADHCPQDSVFIRGVYVSPDRTRQGIATAIMARAEDEVFKAGVAEVSLMATLAGAPLYRALGYRLVKPKLLRFPDGIVFEAVDMMKRLSAIPDPLGRKVAA